MAGDTEVLPEIPTVPTAGLILTDVASDTSQLKIVELPAVIAGGVAVNELMIGRPAGMGDVAVPATVTRVVAIVLPLALVAVKV